MRARLDTPERRDAIRGSADISAAKHLARSYGVSMRRRRRVGPIIYDIGMTARTDSTATGLFGDLRFDDTGRIGDAQLFGTPLAGITMLQLASILEHGPQPEGTTTLVLSEAPEPITAPIPLVRALEDEPAVVVRPAVPIPRRALTGRPRRIVSVPVRVVAEPQPRRIAPTAAQRRAVIMAAESEPWRLWTRLTIGLALTLAALVLVFLVVTTPVAPQFWTAVGVGIVIFGAWGIGLARSAIRANDHRLEALATVS